MEEQSLSIPPASLDAEMGDAPVLGGERSRPMEVETFAGDGTRGYADGPGASARFNFPRGLAVDAAGVLYVAEWEGHRIRRITPDGVVSTLAGNGLAGFADGEGPTARFYNPRDVAVDRLGTVYVADTDNHRIRKITPDGVVTTLTGEGTAGFADGPRATARFHYPNGVAVDDAGVVYVADASNVRVRRVTPGGTVSTLAGDSVGGFADAFSHEARFYSPRNVVVDPAGWIYVADFGNSRIRLIAPTGRVTTVAGDGRGRHRDGRGVMASIKDPCALALGPDGYLYIADGDSHCIRRLSPEHILSTIAGDGQAPADFLNGPGPQARFNTPRGIAVAPNGVIYVADTLNHCIRRLMPG